MCWRELRGVAASYSGFRWNTDKTGFFAVELVWDCYRKG